MDNEREEQKKRKATVEFNKQRRKNYLKKKSRNKSELNREEITYGSGIALNLNPDLLQQATVPPETFKEFENTVATFTCRPPKKCVRCPTGEISSGNFVLFFSSFSTPKQAVGGRKPKYYNLQPKPNKATNFQNIHFQKRAFLLTLRE